ALLIRWRVLETHLGQLHLELLGDQHRDRRVSALAHFDIWHRQHDRPVDADANERVRRERLATGRGGRVCVSEVQTQKQATTGSCGGPQYAASRGGWKPMGRREI